MRAPKVNLTPDGYHADRLKPNRENPREVAFAEQWKREHERDDVLGWITCLEPDPNPAGFNGMKQVRELSEGERKVAATVIQWLGSNVGMSFMREALEECGYRIEQVKQ